MWMAGTSPAMTRLNAHETCGRLGTTNQAVAFLKFSPALSQFAVFHQALR